MSSSKRSSSVKVLPTVLGVIVVVAIIAVIGEIGVRMFVSKQIAEGYRTSMQQQGITVNEDPEISYGSNPVLFALASKNLPELTMTTPNTLEVNNPEALSGQPEIKGDPASEIYMTNVDLNNREDPTAENVRINVTVPSELIQALINRDSGARITKLAPLAAENAFNVEFSSGIATSKVQPVVNGGNISIKLVGGSLLNLNLDGLAKWIGDNTDTLLSYDIGHGLTVEEATVTEGGLALTLSGANLPLSTVNELHFN